MLPNFCAGLSYKQSQFSYNLIGFGDKKSKYIVREYSGSVLNLLRATKPDQESWKNE